MDRLRRTAGTAMIVVLVILDIVLVVAAERHASHPSSVANAAPIRPFHVTGLGSSTPSSPPTTTTPLSTVTVTTTRAHTSVRPALLLSAFNADVAISANGGCTGKPHLASTSNGGASFTPLTAPAAHVLRVDATGATSAWLVGAGASCTPVYYSTADAGKTWSRSATLGRVWVAMATGVSTPSAGLAKPCGTAKPQPLALAPAGFTAAMVVCHNGVRATSNGGTSWTKTGALPAGQPFAAALATGGNGLVLLSPTGKCSGVRVAITADSGAHWSRGSCLKGATEPAGVALTDAGAGLVVGHGGATYVSTNFGKTWTT